MGGGGCRGEDTLGVPSFGKGGVWFPWGGCVLLFFFGEIRVEGSGIWGGVVHGFGSKTLQGGWVVVSGFIVGEVFRIGWFLGAGVRVGGVKFVGWGVFWTCCGLCCVLGGGLGVWGGVHRRGGG